MNRRHFLATSVATAALAACASPPQANATRKPNIIKGAVMSTTSKSI